MGTAGAEHTDLYAIRMAASYLRHGLTGTATFSLFLRELPPERGFLVVAGLADCLSFLEGFRFTAEELGYLASVAELRQSDVDALRELTFTGDVWAVPEGCLVFAPEPVLEVTAPLPQAQLVEMALLNYVTFQSSVATKAARCRIAAGGAQLVDFGARRTDGFDTALAIGRACAMTGFAGSSHVGAARRYGLPLVDTMVHSYVRAFGDEHAAFRAYATDFPEAPVFVADTVDALGGVRTAVAVARELGLPPDRIAVRLTSGDRLGHARAARKILDEAGYVQARIMLSGGLDEYELERLTVAEAPVDAYGVGSKLGLPADAPSVDTAYRLVEYDGRPVATEDALPGPKQVHRRASGDQDVLSRRDEPAPPGYRPVLSQVMRAGKRLRGKHSLAEARQRFERDLLWVPSTARRLRNPEPVEVRYSPGLVGDSGA